MRLFFITKDRATPELKAATARIKNPGMVLEAAAQAVSNLLRRHFRGRGGGFWSEIANATSVTDAAKTKAVVTVADYRFLHKIKGGTVVPKRKKYLTIPLIPAAKKLAGKGTVERSAPFLKLAIRRPKLFLVKTFTRKVKDGVKQIKPPEFWFVLKKSVTHKPDPNALPPNRQIEYVINDAVRKLVPRLLRANR